mgnify:CR=1 FL=1
MSRVGKKPVVIPQGVECKINGNTISFKGPKGSISKVMPTEVAMEQKDGKVVCSVPENSDKDVRAKFGLVRALVNNMVTGVNAGFSKGLEIIGVGYKAQNQSPSKVLFNIGYSHPVIIEPPAGITITVEANTKISVKGSNKQTVGDVAAAIRSKRPPEVYKGKGVRYEGEYIRRKAGKAGKK